MKEEVIIEKDVPMPAKFQRRAESKGPLKWEAIRALTGLKKGMSILIKGRKVNTVRDYYLWIPEGLTGYKYHAEQVDNDVTKTRVWRII
jgi:uncharacterized protein YcbK (DUF882 family)